MNSDGYPLNSTFPDGVASDALVSLDETANISLGDNEININAQLVLVNGLPITGVGGFVTNPMSAELNANDYNLTNVGLINGLDLGTINADLSQVKDKTINIQLPITLDGTAFAGELYADSFVKNGGTSQQYMMADGSSLQYSANSGNSNFYLYDNGTDQDTTPANGFITYNTSEQKQATEIYISHRTRDNIDIEVFFKNLSSLNDVYIQDQSNSDNSITYNITGSPTIVNQAQVTIPVDWTSSSGTGSTSFGNGHNILLSFFTNSIETDTRLTTLEGKTQNQSGDATGTTFTKDTSVVLRVADGDYFTVRNDASPFSVSKLSVSNTSVQINSVPLFMQGQRIRDIGAPVDATDATRKSYVDTAVSTVSADVIDVQERTQNQTATASGTQFNKNSTYVLRNAEPDAFVIKSDSNVSRLTVNNTNVIINGVPLRMQGQRIRDVGPPTDVSDVAVMYTLTAGSVPYFTSNNRLSGATKNQFVQLGNSTIQSAIDIITVGGTVGGSVQVSSGASTENIICVQQNFTLVGAICPNFTQTTQITGNLTIGSAGFISTRVRVSHMKFLGNLIFDNSTNQQLRTYLYNCDWNGTITFPTSTATGTNNTQIFFENCSFSGASAIVIPNQNLYTIFFTRCQFIGQTITNQQPVGNTTKLIFSDCSYLPTLSSLGNCILNGPNTTLTATQANYGSIVLGGTATSLLKGNGTALSGLANQVVLGNGSLTTSNANSLLKGDATTLAGTALQYVMGDATLLTATYPTMTTGVFAVQWTGGAGGTTQDRNIEWRRISDGISTTVWLRLVPFTVTIGTANSNFGVLMTTGTVPSNLSVTGQPCLPLITTFAGATQPGWLVHYGVSLGIQNSAKGAALIGTVCGIPQQTIVSYMI